MELYKLWYWSSTDTGTSVWYVAFGSGSVHNADRTDLNAVAWCAALRSTDSAGLAGHKQRVSRQHSLDPLGNVRGRQGRARNGGIWFIRSDLL